MIYLYKNKRTPRSHEGQKGILRSHESYIAELLRLYIYTKRTPRSHRVMLSVCKPHVSGQ